MKNTKENNASKAGSTENDSCFNKTLDRLNKVSIAYEEIHQPKETIISVKFGSGNAGSKKAEEQ